MQIQKPFHSESRTCWYVIDDGEVIDTLEIGKRYCHTLGIRYVLRSVDCTQNIVTVSVDEAYLVTMPVDRLVNENITALIEQEA